MTSAGGAAASRTCRPRRLVLRAHVALALAAAHDAYPVRARLAVVARERHLAVTDDVVDAAVLQRLGVRPDLDELGVPRQLAYRQARPRADEVDHRPNGRAEAVGDVALRLEWLALDLQISWTHTHTHTHTHIQVTRR